MNLKEINQEIKEAGLINTEKFLYKFLEHEDKVVHQLQKFDGLQSEIYLHNNPNELEQIKFASIFSDFVSLYTGNSSTNDSHITYFDEKSEHFRERKITIPSSLSSEIIPSEQSLIAGYVHPSTKDTQDAIKLFEPLLDSGKSILRPVRTLMVGHLVDKKLTHWVTYYAHGNTSNDHWIIRDNFSRESLPIQSHLDDKQSKIIFNLTLPYFRGINLDRLTKILIEEQDIISPLRKELKDIVMNFDQKENNIEVIRQDILRPQLDKINRHFKNYKNAHKWKVSGSVALFTLSLIKIVIPVTLINEFVNSIIAGSGFTGMIFSEREYQAKMNELRDNPYFLLWRIQKQPRL